MNKSIFKFSNIFICILYAFVFLCVFVILSHFTLKSSLCLEDTNYIRHHFDFFNRIWSFLGFYITRVILFELPNALNMHVYSTLWVWRSFEYITMISIIFMYSRFLTTQTLKFCGFLFTACLTLYVTIFNFEFIQSSYVFNRYIFSLALFWVFHWFYIKNLIEFDCQNKKYDAICVCMLLILANSTEIFTIETAIIWGIVSVVSFILKRKKFSYIILGGFIASLLINIFCSDILRVRTTAEPKNLDIEYFFPNFWSYCIYKISDILIFLIVICIISVFILIKNKQDYKIPLYSLSAIVANILAMMLLIFFDWRFLFKDKIMLIYYLNYTIPLFLLVSYIYEHVKHKKIFMWIVIIGMIISMTQFLIKGYNPAKLQYMEMMRVKKIKRETIYQYEKAIRYAHLTGRKPIIYYEDMLFCELNDFVDKRITNALKYVQKRLYDKKAISCVEYNSSVISVFNTMTISYKYLPETGFCVTNNKSDMIVNISEGEKIRDDLAIVTNEELEKTDFSKLKDDNFVLNKDNK